MKRVNPNRLTGKRLVSLVSLCFAALLLCFVNTEVKADTKPIDQAQILPLGKTISFPKNENDYYYTIDVPKTGILKYKTISGRIEGMEINDANDTCVIGSSWEDSWSYFVRAGKYALRVRPFYPTEGVFYFVDSNESFAESETSNNDQEETASVITDLNGTLYRGVITNMDKYDWYKITLKSNVELRFTINETIENQGIKWLLNDASGIYISDGTGSGTNYLNLDKGTYYLRISTGKYHGVYTFKFNTGMQTNVDTVKVKTTKFKTTKKGKLTVNWQKITNKRVSGYQIQMSYLDDFEDEYGDDPKSVREYKTKNTAKSKKLTIPKSWRKYKVYVRVRAYTKLGNGQTVYSQWSKTKTVKPKK